MLIDEMTKKKLLRDIAAYLVVAVIIIAIAAIIITRRPAVSNKPAEPNVTAAPEAPAVVNVPAAAEIVAEAKPPAAEAEKVRLLCKNPVCRYRFQMNRQEVEGKMPVRPGVEIPVFKCPKCEQNSAYIETTCEKCGNIFVLSYQQKNDYADRCPKCGFSKFEEAVKGMSE